ncbi:MAG: hypothetical protein JO094_05470 [Hyphomicrobiales bacterium]|nr:hypothetical protein [Hyphomicrobiales bacterium]
MAEPILRDLDSLLLVALGMIQRGREPLPESLRDHKRDVIPANVPEPHERRDEAAKGVRVDAEGDRDGRRDKPDREGAEISPLGEFRPENRVLLTRGARAKVSSSVSE